MLKRTLFCVFGVMECVFEPRTVHYFLHTVHYCCSSMPLLSETCNFYKAHCSEKRGVLWLASYPVRLWLAEYLKHVTEMLRPFPCCDAVSRLLYGLWCRCDETKTIKPAIIQAFVAFSEDIMTDYKDSYGLFTHCAASSKHNTICAFAQRQHNIHLWLKKCQTSITLHCSNSCLNSKQQIL